MTASPLKDGLVERLPDAWIVVFPDRSMAVWPSQAIAKAHASASSFRATRVERYVPATLIEQQAAQIAALKREIEETHDCWIVSDNANHKMLAEAEAQIAALQRVVEAARRMRATLHCGTPPGECDAPTCMAAMAFDTALAELQRQTSGEAKA